ncbi:hypothetical protein C8R45DRAFT_1164384 [Mycena sanguinolenta]|nr:hypothetical protein C8R45DRAFT_1164384 [Mycena sanguinolenta]
MYLCDPRRSGLETFVVVITTTSLVAATATFIPSATSLRLGETFDATSTTTCAHSTTRSTHGPPGRGLRIRVLVRGRRRFPFVRAAAPVSLEATCRRGACVSEGYGRRGYSIAEAPCSDLSSQRVDASDAPAPLPSPFVVLLSSRLASSPWPPRSPPRTTQTSASSSPSAHAPDAPLEATASLNTCRRCASRRGTNMPRVGCGGKGEAEDDDEETTIEKLYELRTRQAFGGDTYFDSRGGRIRQRARRRVELVPPIAVRSAPVSCRCPSVVADARTTTVPSSYGDWFRQAISIASRAALHLALLHHPHCIV